MAGSVNKVILVGNLGKDPEVRRTTAGDPIVNLSLATSESWRDKASGERKEKTEWHRVVIFNKNLAEVATDRFTIGSPEVMRRTSGSLPRLPTKITLLTLPAMTQILSRYRCGP